MCTLITNEPVFALLLVFQPIQRPIVILVSSLLDYSVIFHLDTIYFYYVNKMALLILSTLKVTTFNIHYSIKSNENFHSISFVMPKV